MERLDSTNIQHPDWTGWTLIQPCISVGHLGQLAVDVLITHLRPERLCSFYHPALYPVCGSGAYKESSTDQCLNSALELYFCKDKKLVLLQQRSACIPGMQADFCTSLADWIGRQQFGQVVILSSLDSQIRKDSQLHGDQLRYICNSAAEHLLDGADVSPKTLQWTVLEPPTESSSEAARMLGSGLAKRILSLLSERSIPATVVFPFSQAGVHDTEARHTAMRLNQWLQLIGQPSC